MILCPVGYGLPPRGNYGEEHKGFRRNPLADDSARAVMPVPAVEQGKICGREHPMRPGLDDFGRPTEQGYA